MSLAAYKEFIDVCAIQDVEIPAGILQAGFELTPKVVECYTPTPELAAISQAGVELKAQPDKPLIDRLIKLPRRLTRNIGLTTLTSILNESLEPAEVDDATWSISSNFCRRVETCCDAELHFSETLATMADMSVNPTGRIGGQILTHQGQAVGLRKSSGEPSTLTFADVNINGITYPAGSLLRVELTRDLFINVPGAQMFNTLIPKGVWSVVDASEIQQAAFMRLSAFALSPSGRRVFSAVEFEDDVVSKKLYKHSVVADLAQIATAAVAHIQAKPEPTRGRVLG